MTNILKKCLITLSVVLLITAACVSVSTSASLPDCKNVAHVFIESKRQGEIIKIEPTGDGGAAILYFNTIESTVRGILISSPHVRKIIEKQGADLTKEGQCQAEGLVFEVSGVSVKVKKNDPT